MSTIASTANVKRPGDTVTVTFDFVEFASSVIPGVLVYLLRGEPGLTYSTVSNVGGFITLNVSGGVDGRRYVYGYEARTTDGQAMVDTRVMRVREVDGADLPDLGSAGSTEDGLVVLDYEFLILDDLYLVLT